MSEENKGNTMAASTPESSIFELLLAKEANSFFNDKIFEIIGPAFHTVVGCFVGMISANFIRK